MDRLRAMPSVESVGVVENIPLNEGVQSLRFRTEGSGTEADTGPLLGVTFTGSDYFRTMGIELLGGRPFTARGGVVVGRQVAQRTVALGQRSGCQREPRYEGDVLSLSFLE